MEQHSLRSLHADIQDSTRTMLGLRTSIEQREEQARAFIAQQAEHIRQEIKQSLRELNTLAQQTSARIARDTQDSMFPVAEKYDRAVTATSNRLHEVNRMIMLWSGSAIGVMLLVLVTGWAVLGYFRRELASAQDDMQHHENANLVLEAFNQSDAFVCGDRLCVNINPSARRQGDKKQYRPARDRPAD